MTSRLRTLTVAFTLFTCGAIAEAQQTAKIPRIAFISGSEEPGVPIKAFQQALEKLGYVEGKNIALQHHSAQGKGPASTADLARRLVRQNFDVLVITPLPAILAAKQATKKIPIVIITSVDPVDRGIVDSLARPGGNITGTTRLIRELAGKRLELLKEVVPSISRVGILQPEDAIRREADFKQYQTIGDFLNLRLRSIPVPTVNADYKAVFELATRDRLDALIAMSYGVINRHAKRIAELAVKSRIPLMFERSVFVEQGGLVSYSADESESFRRAAVQVDKILKGVKPADIPVEQPMKFNFVVNLKTANEVGLTIPQWTLMKADRVIR